MHQHDRVGAAVADVAAGGQLGLLFGGEACSAVRADEQPGGALALGGPVGVVGQRRDAVQLGVDPERGADQTRDGEQRAPRRGTRTTRRTRRASFDRTRRRWRQWLARNRIRRRRRRSAAVAAVAGAAGRRRRRRWRRLRSPRRARRVGRPGRWWPVRVAPDHLRRLARCAADRDRGRRGRLPFTKRMYVAAACDYFSQPRWPASRM